MCFGCGLYGHNAAAFPKDRAPSPMEETTISTQAANDQDLQRRVEEENYGLWMLVERRQRRKGRSARDRTDVNHGGSVGGSRFNVLSEIQGETDAVEAVVNEKRSENGSKVAFGKKRNGLKAKRKGVVVASGPKMGFKVLRPSTNVVGS